MLRTKVKKSLALVLVICLVLASMQTIAFAGESLGTWTTKVSMHIPRYGLGVVDVNGRIYAIGGYNTNTFSDKTEEYDPVTNEWATKADMPTARRFFGVEEVNNKIYAIGGYEAIGRTSTVEEYDPISNEWTTKADMTVARHFLGVAKVNNKIYAIGGNSIIGASNVVEEYDPVTNEWTMKANMPTARYGLGVVAANNKIYAIGGYTEEGRTRVVEEYDPLTNTWEKKAEMPTARYGFGVAQINNKVYAIGGSTNTGSTAIVERYDPEFNIWEGMTDLSTASYFLGVTEMNNKIFAVGGFSSTLGYLSTMESYYAPQAQNITLGIDADSTQISYDSQIEVFVKMEGASNIYGEYLQLSYDTALFELLNVELVNSNLNTLYLSDQIGSGQARYLMASKGSGNSISGTANLLKLTFKVIGIRGWGDIAVSSGIVSDGSGTEIVPVCLGKTFIIDSTTNDINKDGKFTVADLAILAKLYNTTSEQWGTYQPDVNNSGAVEDMDLNSVVDSISNNTSLATITNIAQTIINPEDLQQPVTIDGIPSIVDANRIDDTTIAVTLNKDCIMVDAENNGGFTVHETGNAENIYNVISTTKGKNASEVIITVEDISASANAGLTLKYSNSNNGSIEDLTGNILNSGGANIGKW